MLIFHTLQAIFHTLQVFETYLNHANLLWGQKRNSMIRIITLQRKA